MIIPKLKQDVYALIFQELKKMGCYCSAIKGMPDHIHILFKLKPKPKQNLSYVIKQVKGSSFSKIEDFNIIENFKWQVGYGGFSVRESTVGKVKRYIESQEKYHANMNFGEEYNKLLKLNRF